MSLWIDAYALSLSSEIIILSLPVKTSHKTIFQMKEQGFRIAITQGKQGIYFFIFGTQGKHEIYQNN